MALKVLIIGKSGSGKTFSEGTLPPAETFVFAPDKKYPQLPEGMAPRQYYKTVFKRPDAIEQMKKFGWDPNWKINEFIDLKATNYLPFNNMFLINRIIRGISANRPDIHYVAIDTVTHGLVHSVMEKANETGYDKFVKFAMELYDLIDIIPDLREDLFVFFYAHEMVDNTELGTRCMQIPAGKLTKEKIVPEARFDEVLWANVVNSNDTPMYYFSTVNDGSNTARSRLGVFPGPKIPNDALYVAQCIRAYEFGTEKPEPKVINI